MPYSERPGESDFPLTRNAPKVTRDTQTPQTLRVNSLRVQAQRRSDSWAWTKRVLAGMLCLFCMFAGTVVGSFYWKSDLAQLILKSWLSHPIDAIIKRDPLQEFTVEKQLPPEKQHIVNVLLLGCDKDYDERKPVAIKDSRGRSDAILLCRVDFDNHTIHAMSIPRDTAVHFPTDSKLHKINAAHSTGGPELTIDTIRQTFGLPVDYYATLDFDGFQKVVDAIGGIELNVPKVMKYDDNWGNLHIDLKPGFQKLTGYQAMGYVRMRHDDNDLARAERQQQFVEALRSKVKNPTNFLKLPDVLQAITTSIETNMTQSQMLALGNFARQLKREDVKLATLPVIESRSFVFVNVPESERVIRDTFYPDGLTPISINAPARTQVATRRGEGRRKKGRNRPTTEASALEGADTEGNNGESSNGPTDPTPPLASENSDNGNSQGDMPPTGNSNSSGGSSGGSPPPDTANGA